MTIDLEKMKTERAELEAARDAAAAEVNAQVAKRDAAVDRLRIVYDLIRLGELYAGVTPPEPEIPL